MSYCSVDILLSLMCVLRGRYVTKILAIILAINYNRKKFQKSDLLTKTAIIQIQRSYKSSLYTIMCILNSTYSGNFIGGRQETVKGIFGLRRRATLKLVNQIKWRSLCLPPSQYIISYLGIVIYWPNILILVIIQLTLLVLPLYSTPINNLIYLILIHLAASIPL